MKNCSLKKNIIRRQSSRSPIGVFDSGLGGLTVVRQLRRLLPSEEILYLGDLAHLPYGTKSTGEIRRRSEECARYLLKKKIKALVIACNSASSVAYRNLSRQLSIPVVDVITPAVDAALSATKKYRIGVIATHATIESGSYAKALSRRCSGAQFFLKPCSLFVPLVEEGWLEGDIAVAAAHQYLDPVKKKDIDTLILGCTHYPLLAPIISQVMGSSIRLVDSAVPTAHKLAAILKKNYLNYPKDRKAPLRIFVTDFVRNFARIGETFLGEELKNVKIVKVP